jgi:hypothetical protein
VFAEGPRSRRIRDEAKNFMEMQSMENERYIDMRVRDYANIHSKQNRQLTACTDSWDVFQFRRVTCHGDITPAMGIRFFFWSTPITTAHTSPPLAPRPEKKATAAHAQKERNQTSSCLREIAAKKINEENISVLLTARERGLDMHVSTNESSQPGFNE